MRPVSIPLYVNIALGEIGIVEDVRPGRSNARIEQYHAITRAGAALDDVPWCASFLWWCLEMAGIPTPRSKAASSVAQYGIPCDPRLVGSLLFFPKRQSKRDPDAGGTGHAAIGLGITSGIIYCLGGNQSNRVGIDERRLVDLGASRMPQPMAA